MKRPDRSARRGLRRAPSPVRFLTALVLIALVAVPAASAAGSSGKASAKSQGLWHAVAVPNASGRQAQIHATSMKTYSLNAPACAPR